MKTIFALLLTMLCLGCGYGTQATTPPQAGVTPAIMQLAPDTTNSGGPAFMLTVNGSNFASNAAVNWGGTAQTTTFVSANQLAAAIPAAAITTPGTVAITVTNPGVAATGLYGGGTLAATSTATNFTIN